jgi:DNA primase catalytic core
MEGLGFAEAVKKLAEPLGIKLNEKEDPSAGLRKRLYALMSEAAAFYRRCLLQTKEASLAREYLKGRLIDEKLGDEWTIGYAPAGVAVMLKWGEKHKYTSQELEQAGLIISPTRPGDKGYHRFGGRLMFSIKDRQGRVVAFSGRQLVADKKSGKYVNSPETVIFKKSNVLFGFDKAAAAIARSVNRECIVCEGQIDTIRLHAAGFNTAVASQGTAFTIEHAKMLKKVSDSAVLMYDDDVAGRKATIKVARMLLQLEIPVRTVTLPDGNDPDSYLKTRSPGDLRELIERAESIVTFQVRAEIAKEVRPDSIDAISRISKSVLQTVACAKSAVQKASMLKELSRLLKLPVAALDEELRTMKFTSDIPNRIEELPGDECADGRDVLSCGKDEDVYREKVFVPAPPKKELEFLGFLFNNERDVSLAKLVRRYLPSGAFTASFSREFIGAWLAGCDGDEAAFGAFTAMLDEREMKWFGEVISFSDNSVAGAGVADVLKKYVCSVWEDALKRIKGEMSAESGDGYRKRLEITAEIKACRPGNFSAVEGIIEKYSNALALSAESGEGTYDTESRRLPGSDIQSDERA